ncbi:hypothetical protein [Brochothrix thermosphacta]|uniref:hypothetical protein n=1 Tax=Brochothrix thermosphacta TaxID=2756 RepID=UPI0039AF988A
MIELMSGMKEHLEIELNYRKNELSSCKSDIRGKAEEMNKQLERKREIEDTIENLNNSIEELEEYRQYKLSKSSETVK